MAPILGIIANVCSWICVTAWKMETIKPTTNAPISIGAARREAIRIASIIIETTKASDIVNNFVNVKGGAIRPRNLLSLIQESNAIRRREQTASA